MLTSVVRNALSLKTNLQYQLSSALYQAYQRFTPTKTSESLMSQKILTLGITLEQQTITQLLLMETYWFQQLMTATSVSLEWLSKKTMSV
jgi:hypothetical protein